MTEPMLDHAAMAAKLYPSAARTSEPNVVESEDAELAQKFYPSGSVPPPRRRPAPSTIANDDRDEVSADVESDEARALYGDRAEQEPSRKVYRAPGKPADEAEVPQPTDEEIAEAERETGDAEATESTGEFDESAYDAETVTSYRQAAKELGVEEGVAQQLLQRVAPKLAERQQEQLVALRAQWVEDAQRDPEISAHGAFDENIELAQRVVRRFGSPELRDLLNTSGIGDHPALIQFVLRVGRRLGGSL